MNINEEIIKYNHELPYNVSLCRITNAAPHYHSRELEIIYCLKGSIRLVAGHQNTTISEGEVFSVDYRDIHYLFSDVDNLTLIFHLDLTRLNISWDNLKYIFFACESSHCYPYQQAALDKVKDIILSLAFSLYSHDVSWGKARLTDASDKLIGILFKYFNYFNYENYDDYFNEDLYGRFYRIIAYCNDNYMNKITISQLAEMEHINKNYFSQFISKTVFESFSLMIKYIRCYEAEQLLLKTNMPVYEISYSCGFSDPKYFYSAFKLWWECTPTQHRARYANYMKKATNVTYLSDTDALEAIKEQITRWHMEKAFR